MRSGKKALEFSDCEIRVNRKNLEVDFFGGEPLMNWQVVKRPCGIRKRAGKNSMISISVLH